MMKRLMSLLLCIAMLTSMLTVTAFADPPVNNLSVAVTFDGGNKLDTMQIKFSWPTHLAEAKGRAVLMNKMLRSTVTDIGVGGSITDKDVENFATYGDFTHIGYYSKVEKFGTFDKAKNYFDPNPDDNDIDIISAPSVNAAIKPGKITTVNLDIPDGSMENGKIYYVYLWTYYKGNLGSWRYYPDTLLCAIIVDDDGTVECAVATGRNTYDPSSAFKVDDDTSYNITYDPNGGKLDGGVTTPVTMSYTAKSAAVSLPRPTREGYTFIGWEGPGLSGPTVNVTIPKGSVGNRAYTANWKLNTYTINYDGLDGATVNPANPTEYSIAVDDIILTKPEKPGYNFTGWTGSNGTTAEPTVTIDTDTTTGNLSYTATWSDPITYTIDYDLTGGTVATANPVEYNVETADFTLNKPTREHYTFTGWTGSNGTTADPTVTITKGSTGNKTYTANWTADPYTITYNLNGGAVAEENPTGYNIESATFTLNKPTREGYTFAGWEGTGLIQATKTVTIANGSFGDRSYEATWTPIEYTITYNLGGGSANNPAKYTIESNDIVLTAPTREGYTFTGWTGSNGTITETSITITNGSTENKIYTANWSLDTYGITYDLAGGTVATANPATYTVESGDIHLVNPTRGGYKFAGWEGTDLTEATENVTITAGSVGARSYTATWIPVVYTISYELGEDGTTTNPVEYAIESNTITLTDPTRWGFIFDGWTGNGVTSPTKGVTIDAGSIGNKTFTAHWSPSVLPELLYPGESYVLRSGLDRNQYKVSGFDFTTGRNDYNGISYIESIKIDKNGDLVLTLKENFDLALETARVIRGEITVVDKTTFPRTKHPVIVEAAVNNEVNDVYGSKKAAEAEDINGEWGKNTVIVMDEDGGYVTFSEEGLAGTVKMKKNEKTYLNLIYGVDKTTEDTIDAIEEYLGDDYIGDAIVEYYTFETKAFKNEVDFSYEAYEDDPHYFYLWKNGKLKKIDVKYNDDEDVEAWQWTADAEGTIIVSDVEIVLAAENTKNPNTGR